MREPQRTSLSGHSLIHLSKRWEAGGPEGVPMGHRVACVSTQKVKCGETAPWGPHSSSLKPQARGNNSSPHGQTASLNCLSARLAASLPGRQAAGAQWAGAAACRPRTVPCLRREEGRPLQGATRGRSQDREASAHPRTAGATVSRPANQTSTNLGTPVVCLEDTGPPRTHLLHGPPGLRTRSSTAC